jgi:peptide/nickel transport system permease protein
VLSYIARRIAYLVPTWLGITLLAFVLSALAPGDPARTYFLRAHGRQPSQAELAIVRERFGLDKPVAERYLAWVWGALRGDLGLSYSTGRPVTEELLRRLPATLQLAAAATAVTLAIGVPVGIVAALKRNSLIDQVTRGAAMLGASIPSFWLAYLLIILFSVKLGLLPALGRGGPEHLILPALTLGLGDAAVITRLTRSSVLEVLQQDYVTVARAKGLPARGVLIRHVLRNALIPTVTQLGVLFGFLIAYSAVVEVIFVWPGMGRLAVRAIFQRDYNVIQGFVVLAGTVFVLINLVVDLLYLWLDPRVTLGQSRRVEMA